MALTASAYQRDRRKHWDRVSAQKQAPNRPGAFYQTLLHQYFRHMVPEGRRVLEIGCGHGDLLAAMAPAFGAGVDFSEKMLETARQKYPDLCFIQADAYELPIKTVFDVIILSDLVNDLWDVQAVLESLRPLCHAGTRIIVNFYNNMWRIPLAAVNKLGLGADLLEQNWFAPHDVENLLHLAGFEVINRRNKILFPADIWLVKTVFNRYLVNMLPFKWFALTNIVMARPAPELFPAPKVEEPPKVSVVVAARNEAGHIDEIFQRVPQLGSGTELIFVEGHSTDNTYETVQETMGRYPNVQCRLFQQTGRGKGDAVRLGFEKASGDILMILDADLTVPPEDLYRFYEALAAGKGEFINGVRLVYPMEDEAMRFFNIVGNKFFSLAFTWLLEQPIKDTLCGTKVMWKADYNVLAANRSYFGDFDPFGDFDLLFGAAKLNLKIVEVPVRYRARRYGETNIDRWRHGWMLLKMVAFAAKRMKFI
ncbi:MAG: glycosyltransferase [Desulfobacterales bacterium]|nr:glycosyltransferase [Desulfobacterales bacterium]